MTVAKIIIFSRHSLNVIEENIISDVAENLNIKKIKYQTESLRKRTYLEPLISVLLRKEVTKFKNFLLSQDSESRRALYRDLSSKPVKRSKIDLTIGLFLFNPNLSNVNLNEADVCYFIDLDKFTLDLNAYVINCVIDRKELIEIRCFEATNSTITNQFNISCQVADLYTISLFKVYSAVIKKIISMAKNNDIHLY